MGSSIGIAQRAPVRATAGGDAAHEESAWRARIEAELREGVEVRIAMMYECAGAIAAVASAIVACFRAGGKVLFCGNGGSAADAQHLAAEFVGRYLFDRRPLPAIALTTDSSALTAIGNDYGYDETFARQVRALAVPGDVVVGISTSGHSRNVAAALEAAKLMGATSVALVGSALGGVGHVADIAVRVPSASTPRIQEAHIAAGHIVCGLVEAELFG